VQTLFRAAQERFQTVDILVNNAGICPVSPIKIRRWSLEPRHGGQSGRRVSLFREMVNLAIALGQASFHHQRCFGDGVFWLQERQDALCREQGRGDLVYRSLAQEVAAYNIRVNAIAPGIMHTDMTAELLERDAGTIKADSDRADCGARRGGLAVAFLRGCVLLHDRFDARSQRRAMRTLS
jgi:NAD(P)-dependent dehydrogenase (short-subunit alcohol dehydrogenase family)